MDDLPKYTQWYSKGWGIGEAQELQDNKVVDGVLFVPKEQQLENGLFVMYTLYTKGSVYGWWPTFLKSDLKDNYLSSLHSIASVIRLPQHSKMKKDQLVNELIQRIRFL